MSLLAMWKENWEGSGQLKPSRGSVCLGGPAPQLWFYKIYVVGMWDHALSNVMTPKNTRIQRGQVLKKDWDLRGVRARIRLFRWRQPSNTKFILILSFNCDLSSIQLENSHPCLYLVEHQKNEILNTFNIGNFCISFICTFPFD